MTFGRRPLFFLAAGVISVLLLAPTPETFWWVNVTMAGIAFFWFVMLAIEEGQGDRDTPDEPRGKGRPDDLEGEDRR
ncbi:MAG: hypothetical protein QOI81_832 [Actinomycetota bacterium]|jgi:hypothetical protein|nr:hypothetical protein [Actinomycetota bacterium]